MLPAGVDIDLSGDALSIRYEGDVVIEQTFGRRLGDVRAGGDLTIRLENIQAGHLRAGGRLILHGKVDADHLHGNEVHIGSSDTKARAISADERIVIGASKLSVDVIIAPEIVLDPKANGRVTVIEAHNDPGPTKIKGGFSLTDFVDAVGGDPIEYLAERGLKPLEKERAPRAAPPAPGPAPAPVVVVAPDDVPDLPVAAPAAPPARTHAQTLERARPAIPQPQPQPQPPPPAEEDTSDPLSLSVDDLEPIPELEPADDELHPKLMDAVKRIAACYEGKETPPAVNSLRALVESRDYDKLRENITEVWNGLLGFHQKKGIRPHHQVTHAFNVIHGLVQQG